MSDETTITINGIWTVLWLIGITAIGSFLGCLMFVKVFEWHKIKVTVRTKLDISKDAVNQYFTIKEKV